MRWIRNAAFTRQRHILARCCRLKAAFRVHRPDARHRFPTATFKGRPKIPLAQSTSLL